MPKMLRKLSPKTIIGDVKKIVEPYGDGTIIPLYDLVGRVASYTDGVSNYGTWYKFKGQFAFISHVNPNDNGEASIAFLQDPLVDYVIDAMAQGSVPLEFGVRLLARKDSKLPNEGKYEYILESLIQPKESEELSHLKALMKPATLPALPEPEPELESKTETKKAASK